MAALADLAGSRADSLAEVADLLEGVSDRKLDEPLNRQAAGLFDKTRADREAIPE